MRIYSGPRAVLTCGQVDLSDRQDRVDKLVDNLVNNSGPMCGYSYGVCGHLGLRGRVSSERSGLLE